MSWMIMASSGHACKRPSRRQRLNSEVTCMRDMQYIFIRLPQRACVTHALPLPLKCLVVLLRLRCRQEHTWPTQLWSSRRLITACMLPRKPTRIELKADDKEEYEAYKRAQLELEQQRQHHQPQDDFGLNAQVEIKLRLPNQAAHDKVAMLLAPTHRAEHAQENYFFDSTAGELSAQRVVIRLRFYNTDKKAVITVKGKALLQNGVSRATEEEEDVDPVMARRYLDHPDELLAASPLLQAKQRQFSVAGLKALGGFRNVRHEFGWEGVMIELDETQYPWGTLYEIECETTEPEVLKPKLESLLQDAGVDYKYTTTSKFANFIHKTLE